MSGNNNKNLDIWEIFKAQHLMGPARDSFNKFDFPVQDRDKAMLAVQWYLSGMYSFAVCKSYMNFTWPKKDEMDKNTMLKHIKTMQEYQEKWLQRHIIKQSPILAQIISNSMKDMGINVDTDDNSHPSNNDSKEDINCDLSSSNNNKKSKNKSKSKHKNGKKRKKSDVTDEDSIDEPPKKKRKRKSKKKSNNNDNNSDKENKLNIDSSNDDNNDSKKKSKSVSPKKKSKKLEVNNENYYVRRVKTAYNFFCDEYFKKHGSEHDNNRFRCQSKAAEKWHQMDNTQKKKYEDMSEDDKKIILKIQESFNNGQIVDMKYLKKYTSKQKAAKKDKDKKAKDKKKNKKEGKTDKKKDKNKKNKKEAKKERKIVKKSDAKNNDDSDEPVSSRTRAKSVDIKQKNKNDTLIDNDNNSKKSKKQDNNDNTSTDILPWTQNESSTNDNNNKKSDAIISVEDDSEDESGLKFD